MLLTTTHPFSSISMLFIFLTNDYNCLEHPFDRPLARKQSNFILGSPEYLAVILKISRQLQRTSVNLAKSCSSQTTPCEWTRPVMESRAPRQRQPWVKRRTFSAWAEYLCLELAFAHYICATPTVYVNRPLHTLLGFSSSISRKSSYYCSIKPL